MRETQNPLTNLALFYTFFLTISTISSAPDILSLTQSLTGNQTIVSLNQLFKLGFFTPPNSKNRYLGIWYYKKISPQTVVWVANRDNPLTDSSGVLKFSNKTNLVLLDQSNKFFWSSNQFSAANPVAQLLDTGNLVIREEKDESSYKWQSFDYPSNTLLPGMHLGWDRKTGLNRFLVSWKSSSDPARGNYSFKLDLNGSSLETFLQDGDRTFFRSGPWNGIQFSGVPEMKSSGHFHYRFVSNQDEKYYSFSSNYDFIPSRLVINETGALQRYTWLDNAHGWNHTWEAPKDQCDNYNKCGAYGICNTSESLICNCVKGFVPKDKRDWYLRSWQEGCVPRTSFDCNKNAFLELKGMKLPDSSRSYVNRSMRLKDCKAMCLKNCSCTAYANSDINEAGSGSGCFLWFRDLIDLRVLNVGGQILYVRVAASEIDQETDTKVENADQLVKKMLKSEYHEGKMMVIISITSVGVLAIGVLTYFSWSWMAKKRGKKKTVVESLVFRKCNISESSDPIKLGDNPELQIFDFEKLAIATNNFDSENMLGKGGFGLVYKGKLPDGQQIAVKRLSRSSRQGLGEFKNEVVVISKLQHRNLVRLLGCCIQGEEQMLIYEYMPNKSLDSFIFDSTKKALLDWRKRFDIIMGICRGMIYLHRDSRLRVIHRDLKASNILLDHELTPKISDFGMARIFGGDELQANTKRVVGTYGYMPPEYAMEGVFSEKTDVYGFGVLLLEIVSGKRNTSFYQHEETRSLLGYSWKLWTEGKITEVIDPVLSASSFQEEILRCIHVGLLCEQEFTKDRPTMPTIVSMLNSEIPNLAIPKQPAFIGRQVSSDSDLSQENHERCSNTVSSTTIEGR